MVVAPDALFPSDNDCGVPNLRMDKQGDFVDLPVRGWGQIARKNSMRGTWHFYVDDTKFTALWKHPEAVLKTGAVTCVEANYSTDEQMPGAVGLHRIYQKRWMARYWQECGLRVFVDLSVAAKFDKFNKLGVPLGWSAFATRACDRLIGDLERQADIALTHCKGNPLKFLVYGTGVQVREMCGKRDWVFVEDAGNHSRKI